MDELLAALKQFNALDAALYVLAVPAGMLIRFCRAYWHGFGNRATLLAALLYGGGGAFAAFTEAPRGALWMVVQFTSLSGAILVAEMGLRKVPGLPKDDVIADVKHLMPDEPPNPKED